MLYKYTILFILFNTISLLPMEEKKPKEQKTPVEQKKELLASRTLEVPKKKEHESATPRKTTNTPRPTVETTKEQRERHHKERLAANEKHLEEIKKLLEYQHTQKILLELIFHQTQAKIIEKTTTGSKEHAKLTDESAAQIWTILNKDQKELYNKMISNAYMVKTNLTDPLIKHENASEDTHSEEEKKRKRFKHIRPSSFYSKTK